ncbi:MAG: hypothetical protein ACMG6S_21775, partial [Byssovorax sp.]
LLVLTRIKARLPALSDLQRAAFQSLMTDPQRAALGARTKGNAAASDAVTWIVQIDKDAQEYPALFDYYAEERFAYFVECTGALAQRLLAESGKRDEKGSITGTASSASEVAKSVRKRLARRLETYAGDRTAEQDAITEVMGTVGSDDAIAGSIHKLVKLATQWIERADEKSKVLASAAKLTPALCEEALRAAQALTGAAADATETGRARGTDSPAVNVREGSVLREMREAMVSLEEAREQHSAIRRLTPGPGTRAVLGPKRPVAKPTEEQPTAAPPAG